MYRVSLCCVIFLSFPAFSIEPAAPSAPAASDGVFENKVNIIWANITDASAYELYRCGTADTSSCDVPVYSGAISYYDDFDAGIDTYYYRVKACNADGCSDYSDYDVGYRTPLLTPEIPWGIGAWFDNGNALEGFDKVRVSWNMLSTTYTRFYEVYRCTSESLGSCGSPVYSGGGSGSNSSNRYFDDYNGSSGVTYYYRVTACNDWGCSHYSVYSEGRKAITTIPAVPNAPAASVDEYADKVAITFTAVPGENTYRVERCSESCRRIYGNSEFIGLGGETISGSDPWPGYNSGFLPVPGVTYSYKVSACNYAGCSAYSDSVIGRVAGIPNLSTIEASLDSEADKVVLDWADVIGATRYELYRCSEFINTTSCGSFIYSGTSTTYNDTTATPGTIYFYRVKACSVAGCSDFSARANGRIAVVLDVSSKTFYASDGSYADRVELSGLVFTGALTYDLYRCTDTSIGSCGGIIHSGDARVGSPDNNYLDISPEPANLSVEPASGVIYYYRAKWCNAAGCSGYSNYSEGSRPSLALPAIPSGLKASDSTFTDKITVTWSGVLLAAEYTIFRCIDYSLSSCSPIYKGADTLYDDTEVTPGIIYLYRVVACNAAGCSDYSERDEGRMKIPGLVPVASDGIYPDKVVVTWESVSYATRYLLKVCRLPNTSSCIATIDIKDGSTSYTDTSFTAQGIHYYALRICNFSSCSDDPRFSDFTPGRLATPAVPAAPGATNDVYLDKVAVTWPAVEGATEYQVFRCTTTDTTSCNSGVTITGTSYDDASVTFGVTYYYQVKACNLAGCSALSEYDSGWSGPVTDADSDNDGLSDQEEYDIGTDPLDPDSDSDGIMDGLDREPRVSSNLCGGDNAIFEFQTITTEATCATNVSIVVESSVSVASSGLLELIAPSVIFKAGFNVKGQLSVRALSPMPPP